MNQMQSVNGKRPVQATRFRDERTPTAQQDELIRFIYECEFSYLFISLLFQLISFKLILYIFAAWNKVSREVEHYSQNGAENGKGKFFCICNYFIFDLQLFYFAKPNVCIYFSRRSISILLL